MPPALSHDRILDAALVLIDSGGPAQLTMRRLADRLDVTATALYYHFSNRQQLLDAVAERLCSEIASRIPSGGTWRERFEGALLEWYDVVASHPVAMGWVITSYFDDRPMFRLHEALHEILDDAGFSDDRALHIKGAALRFATGHLMLRELKSRAGRHATPSEFPRYRASQAARNRFDPDEHFRIGLAALLTGFERG